MKYEEFLENYSPELQLIEALDLLEQNRAAEAVEILERLGFGSETDAD
jgi:hypothetical protein